MIINQCPVHHKVCFTKRDAETSRNMRQQGRSRIGWKSRKNPGKTGRNKKGSYKEMRIYQCPDCNWWHLTHT